MALGAPLYGTPATATADAASIAVPYPASFAAGDLLFVWLYCRENVANAFSLPGGWSEFASVNGTGGSYAAYYKTAAGSESGNLTVTCSQAGTSTNTQMGRMFKISGWGSIVGGTSVVTHAASPYVNGGVNPGAGKDNSRIFLLAGTADCITNSETDGFATWSGGTNVSGWSGVSIGSTTGGDAAIGMGSGVQSTSAATGDIQVTLQASQATYAGVSISFAITEAAPQNPEISETAGFSAPAAAQQMGGSATANTANFTDAVGAAQKASGSLSDTAAFSDAVDSTFAAAPQGGEFSDIAAFSDAAAAKQAGGGSILDTAAFTDSTTAAQAASGSLSETAVFTDTETSRQAGGSGSADTGFFSDAVSARQGSGASLTDTAKLTDAAGSVQLHVSSLSDTTAFDVLMASAISGQTPDSAFAEVTSFSDAIDCALAIGAALQETMAYSDVSASRQAMGASLAETVAMRDSLDRSGTVPGAPVRVRQKPWWGRHGSPKFKPGGSLW